MKIKINEIGEEITALEKSEITAYAELGKKILPELEGEIASEFAPFIDRIKEIGARLNSLKTEQAALEAEYERAIESLTCFFCKTVNLEGSVFCEECGAKLGEKPREFCEACGTMNRPEQKYCGECGAKLSPSE